MRSRFPNLITTIYEIKCNEFVIVFNAALQDATAIANEFNSSIRFLTVSVTLSNTPPDTYLREITSLSDAQGIGEMTGLPLRANDLLNLLISRFPNAEIVSVQSNPVNRTASIIVNATLDTKKEAQILKFVDDFNLPLAFKIEILPSGKPKINPNFEIPMFVWAARLRPGIPKYVTQDEEFWFDNIAAISSNQLRINRFPGMRDDIFRCYLDLTMGEEHINLRQALLLYDEIWCSLPLAHLADDFLKKQALTEDDLLQLVDAGRLRFVTTQPEERLKIPLLDAVHEHNANAIFGRRTTAALLVADVAHTAELSYLNDSSLIPMFEFLAEELTTHFGLEANELLRNFLWPVSSRRGSLQGLLDIGSMGGPALELAKAMASLIKARIGLDIELEALVVSEAVHISHALNATLLGPLSEPELYHRLKSFIGYQLNFHRHFNPNFAVSWIENEERRITGTRTLPAVRLFEFDTKIPIQEILDTCNLYSTKANGRSLYARLANLPRNERQQEIDNLELMFRKWTHRKSGTSMDLNKLDTIVFLASVLFDFVCPRLASLMRGGGFVIEKIRRMPKFDHMITKLEKGAGKNQELDFLSRIDRVATFRRERV